MAAGMVFANSQVARLGDQSETGGASRILTREDRNRRGLFLVPAHRLPAPRPGDRARTRIYDKRRRSRFYGSDQVLERATADPDA
jgi:hypothetical protein